jgi:hypothetical protein
MLSCEEKKDTTVASVFFLPESLVSTCLARTVLETFYATLKERVVDTPWARTYWRPAGLLFLDGPQNVLIS